MSIKLNIYNQQAEAVGEIELSHQVFGLAVNQALVHQAMVTQAANQRQVLAHTKGRGEVRGGGKKPWRQKGTGRARAGSIRSPIWIGGGVTFGPTKQRNFKKNINKKMRQRAMLMVLSDRVAHDNLVVLDKLETAEYKTKAIDKTLKMLENRLETADGKQQKSNLANSKQIIVNSKKDNLPKDDLKKSKKRKDKRSVLVINDKKDDKIKYSARNLAGLEIINLSNINILDLLKYRDVILTKAGVKALEQRYKI